MGVLDDGLATWLLFVAAAIGLLVLDVGVLHRQAARYRGAGKLVDERVPHRRNRAAARRVGVAQSRARESLRSLTLVPLVPACSVLPRTNLD